MKSTLRIATRKSPLALWQAEHVKSRLMEAHPGSRSRTGHLHHQGDKILDTPLAKIGGKGLFRQRAGSRILEGKADIAAHSIKDVPMEFPEGLFLSTILEREEPCDALSPTPSTAYKNYPKAHRRHLQPAQKMPAVSKRPDIKIKDLRGNVNSRLGKTG